MDSNKIALFLKELRQKKHYTQGEVAELLGVSNKTISKWETAHGYPDISTLPLLAELYGVTIDELLRGEKQISLDPIPIQSATHTSYMERMISKKIEVYILIISFVGIGIVFFSFARNFIDFPFTNAIFFLVFVFSYGLLFMAMIPLKFDLQNNAIPFEKEKILSICSKECKKLFAVSVWLGMSSFIFMETMIFYANAHYSSAYNEYFLLSGISTSELIVIISTLIVFIALELTFRIITKTKYFVGKQYFIIIPVGLLLFIILHGAYTLYTHSILITLADTIIPNSNPPTQMGINNRVEFSELNRWYCSIGKYCSLGYSFIFAFVLFLPQRKKTKLFQKKSI